MSKTHGLTRNLWYNNGRWAGVRSLFLSQGAEPWALDWVRGR
jgi:hypothetical protein